jgi:hypothetical protein
MICYLSLIALLQSRLLRWVARSRRWSAPLSCDMGRRAGKGESAGQSTSNAALRALEGDSRIYKSRFRVVFLLTCRTGCIQ